MITAARPPTNCVKSDGGDVTALAKRLHGPATAKYTGRPATAAASTWTVSSGLSGSGPSQARRSSA